MLTVFLDVVHISACLFLMLVVLLQQGKGGGMGAAFGGGAQQVFGGRGAGNILTRATAICAATFMVTSMSLAYVSSSGDRAIKERIVAEQRKGKGRGSQETRVHGSGKPKAPSTEQDPTPEPSPPPTGGQ